MDNEMLNLASLLEALEDGIYIINPEFTIEFMNRAMVEVFGDGIGQKCHQVLNASDTPCPWCQARGLFQSDSGKTIRRQVHVKRVDRYYDLIEFPLKNADGRIMKLSIYRDISHRLSREEKLRATQEDYSRLFENVGCGVYISTREGHFLNANQALLDMLGYDSKEEFLKMDIEKDLYFNPNDRQVFRDMIEYDGSVVDYEVDFKHREGRPVPVLLTSHVRLDLDGRVLGYEGVAVDQTQRKQMEEEIKAASDFLNKIIHSSPNAIMAADMTGQIILWNTGAEEIIGYSADEVVGKMNIEKIYPDNEARQVMAMLRDDKHGGPGKLASYPLTFVRRDGATIEGNLSAAILYDPKGRELATVGIFVNLKEWLEMERNLRRTKEQLLQSEKLAAMGRLISQIAHELNNPLYGIMNTLELMKTEIPPENKRRKVLEMALSETVRVTDMLRKMLSFSKPDQEERELNDINAIFDEILLLTGKQLREHSIKLIIHLGENIGRVNCSKNQIRQVFLNLIANAREAMPDGGALTVTSYSEGPHVIFELADTGVGIKEENLNKIFDAFFTTKSSVKGVGLGLSVCYGFIKDHGGDIKVDSKPGEGARFRIILPRVD